MSTENMTMTRDASETAGGTMKALRFHAAKDLRIEDVPQPPQPGPGEVLMRNRYVGIFSYVAFPDMVGRVERTRQLYGRVLPIHLEREGLRADALVD